MWKPDVMVIGPGGSKGFLEIGCLKRLFEEQYFLKNIHTWAGISVGAGLSLLLVTGYKIQEIIDISLEMNIVEDIATINLDEAKEKLGLIRNKSIEEKLRQCLIRKIGFIPTLNQLYLITGVKLVMVSFNLDKYRVEYLDKDTEPELSCLEAAMMSMAVPLLIQPRKYKGDVYCDGAIGAPYPVLHFDKNDDKVLGLYISSEEDLYCSDKKPTNYVYRLIQAGMRTLRNFEINYSSKNVKNIALKTLIKDTTGLSIDRQTREKMIEYGYECADNFLKVNTEPEKYEYKLNDNEEIEFE